MQTINRVCFGLEEREVSIHRLGSLQVSQQANEFAVDLAIARREFVAQSLGKTFDRFWFNATTMQRKLHNSQHVNEIAIRDESAAQFLEAPNDVTSVRVIRIGREQSN